MKKAPSDWSFKKIFKTFGKPLLFFEVALLAGSYALWHRMNTSSEFRWYLYRNYPSIVEGYYRIGETISDKNRMIRETDLITWAKIPPKSQ